MAVRGSAAASIILYTLGVTDIDPLEHSLVFERFLNVERREMPDVDIDFAEDRRDEMIRYAAEKYGARPRSADHHLRDAGRQGLDPRRGPRARHELRRRRPRRAAGADDAGVVRDNDDREGVRGGPGVQAALRSRRDDREAYRHGPGARGRRAPRQHARRGRCDRAGAARQPPPAPAPVIRRAERAADDAVRDVGRRGARPAKDGLPRAHEPDDPRQGASTSSRRRGAST